jgi:hypothetical protein
VKRIAVKNFKKSYSGRLDMMVNENIAEALKAEVMWHADITKGDMDP